MRAPVEQFGPRVLLRPADRHGFAVDDLGHPGAGIVEVADEDRFGRADDDARRFQPHVEAVGAEVALLRRVILGVDEDGVVRAGGDAGLAPDADGLVEVHDSVRPLVHRRRGARGHARGVIALVAARHLERPPRLREHADIHVFHVRAGDGQRDGVLGLAGGGTRVAADTSSVVDDFRPFHRADRHG